MFPGKTFRVSAIRVLLLLTFLVAVASSVEAVPAVGMSLTGAQQPARGLWAGFLRLRDGPPTPDGLRGASKLSFAVQSGPGTWGLALADVKKVSITDGWGLDSGLVDEVDSRVPAGIAAQPRLIPNSAKTAMAEAVMRTVRINSLLDERALTERARTRGVLRGGAASSARSAASAFVNSPTRAAISNSEAVFSTGCFFVLGRRRLELRFSRIPIFVAGTVGPSSTVSSG